MTITEPAFAAGDAVPAQPAPTPPPVAGPGHRHVEPRDSKDAYQQAHSRCRALRGRASEYRCVDCRDRPAEEWALVADPIGNLGVVEHRGRAMWFSDSPWDLEPKCSACHRAEDWRRRLEYEAQWEQVLSPVPYQRDDDLKGWWYR